MDSGTNQSAGILKNVFFPGFSVRMWGLVLGCCRDVACGITWWWQELQGPLTLLCGKGIVAILGGTFPGLQPLFICSCPENSPFQLNVAGPFLVLLVNKKVWIFSTEPPRV